MKPWFEHCLEAAARQRRYAHSLRRAARRIRLTQGYEHVAFADAREALKDAIEWVKAARIEKIRLAHSREEEGYEQR